LLPFFRDWTRRILAARSGNFPRMRTAVVLARSYAVAFPRNCAVVLLVNIVSAGGAE
jgi:hypothetical protein